MSPFLFAKNWKAKNIKLKINKNKTEKIAVFLFNSLSGIFS